MKLSDLLEDTTLAFTDRKTSVPMKTFNTRTRIRKAVQTNLVVNDTFRLKEPAKTFYVISDIPPITTKQWRKLIDVSFGKESEDHTRYEPAVGIPPNNVRWSINMFPYFHGSEPEGTRTNEIWDDKKWDEWEEWDEPLVAEPFEKGVVQPTEIKTMTWKQFATDAVKRFPFKPEHDFSE